VNLAICPVLMKGGSTGFIPIHVSTIKFVTKIHSFIFLAGPNFFVFGSFSVRVVRIINEATRASVPPTFEGTARKIAYANRKYHSG